MTILSIVVYNDQGLKFYIELVEIALAILSGKDGEEAGRIKTTEGDGETAERIFKLGI